jgi:hypothetical protein
MAAEEDQHGEDDEMSEHQQVDRTPDQLGTGIIGPRSGKRIQIDLEGQPGGEQYPAEGRAKDGADHQQAPMVELKDRQRAHESLHDVKEDPLRPFGGPGPLTSFGPR